MNINREIAILLAGTSLAAFPTHAFAQTADSAAQPAPAQPTDAQASTVDQNAIIITATKRAELLIDVPQSVSVVTGKTLEEQHATNFQDYLKLVPGLQLNQDTPGEGRLIVRGLNTGGVASTVSVYVDESPFGSSTGLVNGAVLAGDFDTFDVDRIEVLRGPQGTLYGASSLGGVLRFVTAAPSTDAFIAHGRVGIEAVDDGELGYSGNLAINVPLGPTLAFRASGNYRKDGGFIDSIGTGGSDLDKNINDDRVYGGRASLLFKPSEKISLRLSAIAQNIDTDAPTVIEADPVTLKPVHGLSQSQFVPQFSNLHYRLYNATGNFDLGFANLTSSTSFSKQDQDLRVDLTFPLSGAIAGFPTFQPPPNDTFGPNEFFEPQKTDLKKFTQELRLSGETSFADWLIGGFYTHENGLIEQDLVTVEPGTLILKPPPAVFGPTWGHLELHSKYEELAGFADATVHITPQFDLQFGGRYSGNNQKAHQTTEGPLAGGTSDFSTKSDENVFTYSVAPKYKINPNTTVYARVAKGFRPGGPNVISPDAPPEVPRTFSSDSVTSWEVGVKAQTADHLFSIDAAAFHIKWKDIQLFTVLVVDTPAGPVPFGVNINGSGAKSDGVELTATARPLAGLDLSLNGAYTNARLTDDTPVEVGGFKGDKLPYTPKLSVGLLGDYYWRLGSNTRAHVGASLRHLSGQTADYDAAFVAAHGHQRKIDAYSVVDLNAGVDFGRFNVEAYAKNIGNSRGVTSTTGVTLPIFPDGAIGTGIIRPRTFGLTLGFDY